VVSLAAPLTRAATSLPMPLDWAMARSTGPPGANCTMAKLSSMIPNSVGIMSSSLRAM